MNGDPIQPIWSSLWPADTPASLLQQMAGLSHPRRLADGELLYARGDAPLGLIGVERGLIRNVYTTPDGHEILFGVFSSGDWFGEISLFDDLPRPLDAIAVGETSVQILPAAQFRALLDSEPAWYRHFARVLCNKLRVTFDTLADLFGLPLALRLTKRLLDLARAYGKPCDNGIRIDLTLSQEELGRMLGASRQSINKELTALRRRKLIALERGRITLLQPAALAQMLVQAHGAVA